MLTELAARDRGGPGAVACTTKYNNYGCQKLFKK